jgi:penicillin-binding protein 2
MAVVAAAAANGGTVFFPRLVDRIVAQDGTVVEVPPIKVRSNLITDGGLTKEDIEQVRRGMKRVVHEAGGTAARARVSGIEVAGKTGTAQFMRGRVKDNRAWFIAFAPYEEPRWAICVMVEGAAAGGGALAAPIVGKIIEDALKLDDGGALAQMTIEPLDPAPGHFESIASIDFGRAIPAATTAAPAAVEPGGGDSPTSPGQTARAATAPSIRPEADERGRVERQRSSNPISNFFDSIRGRGDSGDSPRSPPRPRRR